MSKSLTISERSEYNQRKKRVKSWCDDRFQIGADLIAIRDKKLYRCDYETFEECCDKEFGVKRAHAYRLIEASEVKSSLGMSPMGDKIVNERQTRALADVPPKKRVAVVKEAAKTGEVTERTLTEAAEKVLAPVKSEEPEVVRDVDGYPVPKPAMAAWERRDEMNDIARLISAARSAVKKLDPEDVMLVEVNLNGVICDLDNAYRTFKQAVPAHVCGICQGQTPKSCALCKGRGVISSFRWLSVPQEIKEMRAKAIQKGAK